MIATEVVSPVDRDEAVRLIASADAEHFWLSGLGTQADVIAKPEPGAMTVSARLLDRVVEYEPADLTVTVEAGCAVGTLQGTLGAAGQFLPVDYSASGTVGGLIATARQGPRSLGYGAVRDRLLGLTVITAEGTAVRSGSRVVKSVAGFDLPKLYCGSYGTLGLIVEATFKVMPLPAASRTLCLFGPRSDLVLLAQRLVGSRLRPTSLVADSLNDTGTGARLFVTIEGSRARVERLDQAIGSLAAELRLQQDHSSQLPGWPPYAGGTERLLTLHLDPVDARQTFVSPAVAGRVIADLGSGQVMLMPDSALTENDLSALQARLRPGNSLAYAGGPEPLLWRRLDPVAVELARRLKRHFDPTDRFNRGLLEKLL